MENKIAIQIAGLVLFAIGFDVAIFSGPVMSQQGSLKREQAKSQKLREIAMKRDVEVEVSSGCDFTDISLEELMQHSRAIIYGRIIDSRSYFDESGDSMDVGEVITTEYTVEVLQVVRDRTLESMPPQHKSAPAPLVTPLRIARNGGVVVVNGHKASVKVKGYEELSAGNRYLFFLNWSPSYKAYNLTACIFGAVFVDEHFSLKPLGSSKKLERELRDLNLKRLLKQIG